LAASVWVSAQTELQSCWPPGQTHPPPVHEAPMPQAWPQVPQLLGSVWVSLQAPLHTVPVHGAQAPAAHIRPGSQAWPQVPQFAASVWVSVQLPLQSVIAPHAPVPVVLDDEVLPVEPPVFVAPPVFVPPAWEVVLDVPPLPPPPPPPLPQPSDAVATAMVAAPTSKKRQFIRSPPRCGRSPRRARRRHVPAPPAQVFRR
jgi:hypothetical protein